eukprot:7391050-Prymnesium_polylepis.1
MRWSIITTLEQEPSLRRAGEQCGGGDSDGGGGAQLRRMARAAILIAGHLRSLCESEAVQRALQGTVDACRTEFSQCDVFLSTWA